MSKITPITAKREADELSGNAKILATHVENIITEANTLSHRVGKELAAKGVVHANTTWLTWYLSGGGSLPPEVKELINLAVIKTIQEEIGNYADQLELPTA